MGLIGLTKCNTISHIQVKYFPYYNMSPKSKMGRPKLPKSERKKPFPMRFTDAELATFEAKAKVSGKTVRAWITATLTNATN